MENKVGYSRRNFFVPVPTITSFEEFNEELWQIGGNPEITANKLYLDQRIDLTE